jgi:hypothetical protein
VETECMTGYSGTGNRKGRTPLRSGLNTTAPLLDSTNCRSRRKEALICVKNLRDLSLLVSAATKERIFKTRS